MELQTTLLPKCSIRKDTVLRWTSGHWDVSCKSSGANSHGGCKMCMTSIIFTSNFFETVFFRTLIENGIIFINTRLTDSYDNYRYTLLVGKPPFETSSLKDTYQRIKRNEYYIPSKVSHSAQLLIIKLLRPDPATRPGLQQVLDDDFFKGFTPSRMPVSSLTMVPRFASGSSANLLGTSRRPLNELNAQEPVASTTRKDKAAFLEKVSNRRSLGVRVCGAESKLIMPGEAVAEELKEENQDGE